MKYNLNGKSSLEVKELYEQFLLDPAQSGLTSNISNYKNAYSREEIRLILKKVCGTEDLYSITNATILGKVIVELVSLRQKYKEDKSKLKRIKDCGSYINKYIRFLENCDVVGELANVPYATEKGVGYCYIITNPAFLKNYIKIGYTDSLERRLNDLYNTSIPVRFEVYAALKTTKYKEAEELMHKAFEEQRISPDREYFLMLKENALDYLKVIAKGLGGELLIFGKDGKPKSPIKY